MKKKTFVMGLGLLVLVALVVYFLPLLDELSSINFSLFGLYPGKGWHFYSASSSSGMGSWSCEGYRVAFFLCLSDHDVYCRYFEPFTEKDKCLCESQTYYNRGVYSKFCGKDRKCYNNRWEYEFACGDLKEVCPKTEIIFTSQDSCTDWWGSAEAYGFVNSKAECSNSWVGIYSNASKERRVKIYNGFIGDGTHISTLCDILCKNCDSSLCTTGNLCEYSVNPFINVSLG